MLAIIFWMYGGYAWLTNAVSADRVSRPLVLLAGMAGFFLVALTVPDAFDGGGLAFGLAYGVVIAVHIGLPSGATRIRSFRGVLQVGQFNAAIAVAVGTSGAIGGETQACLWWTYFGGDDGLAEESLMAASPARRSILAIRATGMSIWRSFSASVDSRRRRGGGASLRRAVEHRAGRGTRRRRRALSERAGYLSGVSRHRQPGSAIGRCTRLPGQPCRWGSGHRSGSARCSAGRLPALVRVRVVQDSITRCRCSSLTSLIGWIRTPACPSSAWSAGANLRA